MKDHLDNDEKDEAEEEIEVNHPLPSMVVIEPLSRFFSIPFHFQLGHKDFKV